MENKQVMLLIVEDDDGHAELIRDALVDSGIRNPIVRFKHGLEVWNFLSGKIIQDTPVRDVSYLLLLDINMPHMDGIEVLKRVKENEQLKAIPVIMLTTTDDPGEMEQCYKLGCNIYITKPVDFTKFSETLKRLGLFLQIIKL